jgi:putative endonuclease
MKEYFVYIVSSGYNGTLYIGVTGDLSRRMLEHKKRIFPGFTKKYNVNRLVYVELFSNIYEAIHREKCLKKWKRDWKLNLIEENNPEWKDLYFEELNS